MKAIDANEDPYLSLLSLRTTPGMDGLSPAYKLLGRTIRNNMLYQKINPSGIISKKNRVKPREASRILTLEYW